MTIEEGVEPRSDSRQQALVSAAFHHIAAKGFEGLRLRQVAAEVGINHATLHHYFPTKADLIAGVVEYATRQFWPTMPAEGGPAERLRTHLTTLDHMMQVQPELFSVLAELDLRAERDAAVKATLERYEAGWREVLTEALCEGIEQGVWKAELDAPAAVELIIATVKGVRLLPDKASDVLGQLERLLHPLPKGTQQLREENL